MVELLETISFTEVKSSPWLSALGEITELLHQSKNDLDLGNDLLDLGARLWADPMTGSHFSEMIETDFEDVNVFYFLSHLERILDLDYSPSNEDILSVRVPTTGEAAFELKRCVDVFVREGGNCWRLWEHPLYRQSMNPSDSTFFCSSNVILQAGFEHLVFVWSIYIRRCVRVDVINCQFIACSTAE